MTMPVAEKTSSPHTFHMDRRRHAQITGVTDVSSFHETEIILKIDHATMVITGENLHIGKLLLEDGKLDVDGMIDSVIYEKPRASVRLKPFWRAKQP